MSYNPAAALTQIVEDLQRRVQVLETTVLRLQAQIDSAPAFPPPEPLALFPPTTTPPASVSAVMPPDPRWIPIIHRFQRPDPTMPPPCGEVALYLTTPPTQHQNASREVMRILVPGETSWREPTLHDVPQCSTCRAPINPYSNTDLDYLSVMQSSSPSSPSASPAPQKGRARRKPEVDEPLSAADDSPGSSVSPGRDLPPAFPAHTPHARELDADALADLVRIASDFGPTPTAPRRS